MRLAPVPLFDRRDRERATAMAAASSRTRARMWRQEALVAT
jgi:hypothetical protein